MTIKTALVNAALLCALSASAACLPVNSQQRASGALERLGERKLDAQTCEAPRAGTLGAHDGGLWFQDEAMSKRAAAPQERTSWEPEEVLLGYLGGGWGQLVPHPSPNMLVATRGATWSVEEDRLLSPAQLVTLDAATLGLRVWWEAPRTFEDLRLLGRSGASLIVLTVGEQRKAQRLWVLEPEQSNPLGAQDLDPAAPEVTGPPADGLTRWPIMGAGGVIFLADVGPTGQISAGVVKTEATGLTRASAADLILYFSDNTCALAPLAAPETWAALPRSAESCGKAASDWERPILDGAPVAERIGASPAGCKVQHRVALPPLPDLPPGEEALAEGRVAIVQLKPDTPALNDINMRMLVRGTALTASFAFGDEVGVDTVSQPTFSIALPPDTFKAELVRVDGQSFWELRLNLDLPYDPWPACASGQILLEVAEALNNPWRRATVREYVEFGKCE